MTRKHRNADKILTNVDTENAESAPINKMLLCSCGKKYKHRQSLFVHKKNCKQNVDSNNNLESESMPTSETPTNENLIQYLLKENSFKTSSIIKLTKRSNLLVIFYNI